MFRNKDNKRLHHKQISHRTNVCKSNSYFIAMRYPVHSTTQTLRYKICGSHSSLQCWLIWHCIVWQSSLFRTCSKFSSKFLANIIQATHFHIPDGLVLHSKIKLTKSNNYHKCLASHLKISLTAKTTKTKLSLEKRSITNKEFNAMDLQQHDLIWPTSVTPSAHWQMLSWLHFIW
jgi:hypothetical protein